MVKPQRDLDRRVRLVVVPVAGVVEEQGRDATPPESAAFGCLDVGLFSEIQEGRSMIQRRSRPSNSSG